ncbi:MAG: hypothetical protein ACOY9D_01375 [Pseudomonadota bacterium]
MRSAVRHRTNKAKATILFPHSDLPGPFTFSMTAFPALDNPARESGEIAIEVAECLIMFSLNINNHVALLIEKPVNLFPGYE